MSKNDDIDEIAFSMLESSLNREYWDRAVADGSIPMIQLIPRSLDALFDGRLARVASKTPGRMDSFVNMVLEGSTYEPLPDGIKESIWAEWARRG